MENAVTLDQVLPLAKKLTPIEKLRLIEQIAPQIERDLQMSQRTKRKSLRGLWAGLNISSNEIINLRREMWQNFPREDL